MSDDTRMGFNEYQNEALRTAGTTTSDGPGFCMTAMGLSGEAGEYTDLMKKHVFHKHPLDSEKVKKELGDVLWYLAVAAHQHGFTLEDVARANVFKLRARYPHGFDAQRSQNREG